jgi:hypothetical protein
MMHGYEGFADEVKAAMSDLSAKHDLHVLEESVNKVVFKSDRCILSISTEYDYVELHFKPNETGRWNYLGEFLQLFYPKTKIDIAHPSDQMNRIERIRFSLHEKVKLINNYFHPILSGDFSWQPKPIN